MPHPNAALSLDERFDTKWVLNPLTGCHLWMAYREDGYGRFKSAKRSVRAHRFAYERKYGPVPPGLVLDHVICDTRACCNPDHLQPTTIGANANRSPRSNARKMQCPNGHPYDYRDSDGGRRCRKCRRSY